MTQQDARDRQGHEHHDHAHADGGHSHHDHDHHHDHDRLHGSGWFAQLRHALTPHSHDANEAIHSAEEARADGIRTSWVGLVAMLVIAGAQLLIVAISGSVGLLADTVHSLSHAITTIPLILAFKLGGRQPTAKYRYGFGRAEDLVGVFISMVVLGVAVMIGYEAISALAHPRPLTNIGWALAAGLVGFAGNELVAEYRIRGGRRIGSAALIAEGQHARADGLTSLAVVLGILGAMLGFPQADAVVGIVIAAMILLIMLGSLKSVLQRLMDGADPAIVAAAEQVAAAVPGVTSADLRARWSGHRLSMDARLAVSPGLSVRDGERLAADVREELLRSVPHLDRVTIELTEDAQHVA